MLNNKTLTLTVHNLTTGYKFEHKNLSQAEVNTTITRISANRMTSHKIVIEVK